MKERHTALRYLHPALRLCGALLLLSCDNPPEQTTCVNVPDGGCPLDNGANVCQDPTCNAVYACGADGGWILQQVCPPHPHDASTADVADASEGGAEFDVKIDVPPGGYGTGCPSLELPDCTAAEGLACVNTVDCCGCLDLWVCDNGGWDIWGECADGGITVQK